MLDRFLGGGLSGKLGALLLALVLALPARAAEVAIGGVVPGAGTIHQRMLTFRGMRFLHVVRQHTDYSCGAAALATILRYAYGRHIGEHQVIAGLFHVSNPAVVRREGFSLLDLKHYVERDLHMRGVGYRVPAPDLGAIKIPVIVLLDLNGYKHFVVLDRATGDYVFLSDPALGNRVMRRAEFVRDWNGLIFAVIGRGFERDTVLLHPPQPVTAARLYVGGGPVTNAQLLDFGFSRADLF